jgi:hypothetical protein
MVRFQWDASLQVVMRQTMGDRYFGNNVTRHAGSRIVFPKKFEAMENRKQA